MNPSFYPTRPFARALSSVVLLGGMIVLAVAFESPRALQTRDAFQSIPAETATRGVSPDHSNPKVFVAPGTTRSTPGQPNMPGLPPGQNQTLPGMLPPMSLAPGQLSPAPLASAMQGNPRLTAAFARGVEAQRKGDFVTAEAAYREVLQLQPKALSAHVNMALVLLQKKETRRAVWHLKQAIVLAPREPQPRAILAQTYINRKEPRQAYEQWMQLANLKIPDNGQAAFNAGAIAFEQLQKPAEAERWVRIAQTQSKNDDPRMAMLLGRILTARNKHSEAARVLQAAGEKFPQITEIQTALAEAQWQSGQKDQAIATLREVEKSTPATAVNGLRLSQIRVMLGRALAQQKQYPEAAKSLRSALLGLPAKSPAIGTTKRLLAQTLALQANNEEKRGQTKNAIATWGDAVTLVPDNALGYLQRARLMAKIGEDRAALGEYNRALKLVPRDLSAIATAASLEEKVGNPNRALAHWKTVIENRPEDKLAYLNLARVGAKQKQFAAQMDYIETRLPKNPNNRAPYEAILEVGERSGRGELARDWVSTMVKRYPKSPAPRIALLAFDLRHPPIKPDKTPVPTPTPIQIARPTPTPAPTPTSAPNPASTPAITIAPTSKPTSKVTTKPKAKP